MLQTWLTWGDLSEQTIQTERYRSRHGSKNLEKHRPIGG